MDPVPAGDDQSHAAEGRPEPAPARPAGPRRAYLLEFADSPELRTLNAIRWLAAPGPRRTAHVTLRGPYPSAEDPTSDDQRERIEGALIGRELVIGGVGQFQHRSRRTVYLAVADELLRPVAEAPDRPYTAHLTIYSGKTTELVEALTRELALLPPLRLTVEDLVLVTVGVIAGPLDETVLSAEPVAGWLAHLPAPVDASSDRAARLTAITTLIRRLREAAVR